MTFEEAVAAPGRKVQIPDTEVKNGERLLEIFSISMDGAKRTAFRRVPVAELDALVADLQRRGLAVAGNDAFCDFVWVSGPEGVEVYDNERLVFQAAGDRATLVDGRVVKRGDIARVITYAERDYVRRGVRAVLRSGEQVELVEESSVSAMGDPVYSRNELLNETGWCSTIAVAITRWAGTGFENQL
jgi:hypothetical protein